MSESPSPFQVPASVKRQIADIEEEQAAELERTRENAREAARRRNADPRKDPPVVKPTVGKFSHPDSLAPATQREAAVSVYHEVGGKRMAVLVYIAGHTPRGRTDEEVQHGLQMNPSTVRPRRLELIEMGLVADSKRTRRTTSGRKATVWVATDAGRRAVREWHGRERDDAGPSPG